MDRETKVIETPVSKQKVEIKTYLTGRERRALTNVFIGKVDFSQEGKVNNIDSTVLDKAQDLAWETVIVSVDGSNENIVDKVLDMRIDDYNFVIAEVNKITSVKDFEEKKTA